MENPKATLIKITEMQYSVDSGRTAIKLTVKPTYAKWGDDENASQSSRRTRSPRRDWYQTNQEVDQQDQRDQGY